MNGQIDWGDITPGNKNSNGNKGRVPFLWLKSGNTYTVRPVAKPVIFFKYFYQNGERLRTAICEDPTTCSVKMAHGDGLDTPGERFAILVIDRADGLLKIMEFPKTVFIDIKNWWQATQQNPGGDDGVDWVIQKSGSGKMNTKYACTPTKAAPFTNEEKTMILAIIKDEEGNNAHYLESVYKAHTPEQIEQRLFGDWEPRGGAAPQAQDAQAVPAQAAPVAPAQAPETLQPAVAAPAGGDVAIDW